MTKVKNMLVRGAYCILKFLGIALIIICLAGGLIMLCTGTLGTLMEFINGNLMPFIKIFIICPLIIIGAVVLSALAQLGSHDNT